MNGFTTTTTETSTCAALTHSPEITGNAAVPKVGGVVDLYLLFVNWREQRDKAGVCR